MPLTDLSPKLVLLVAAGGALGAVARYLVSGALHTGLFPWGTFAANLSGSFLLALLLFGGVIKGHVGPEVRLFLGVGVLGAYTTMSTFTVESIVLLEDGAFALFGWNVALNSAVCLAGAYLGRLVAHAVPGPVGV